MIASKTNAVVTMLANDALEAASEKSAPAALLLMDAAISIMVTYHRSASARRELAGMLGQYVVEKVEALLAAEAARD
ncbi:MAG TPA: hypothetical protein VF463_19210 [Sphingobium sp.]